MWDKNLVLYILSFSRYIDIIRSKRVCKYFRDTLKDDNDFWLMFASRRSSSKKWRLTVNYKNDGNYQNGGDSLVKHWIIKGDLEDLQDQVGKFLFNEAINIYSLDYEKWMSRVYATKRNRSDKQRKTYSIYRSPKDRWNEAVGLADMYNDYISQNDGLSESDYDPETGLPYYMEKLIDLTEFDEIEYLPLVAKDYAYIFLRRNIKIDIGHESMKFRESGEVQ